MEKFATLIEQLSKALDTLKSGDRNIILALLHPDEGPDGIYEITTVREAPLDLLLAPLHHVGLAERRYTMQSRLTLSGDQMSEQERQKWESFVGYTVTPAGLAVLAEVAERAGLIGMDHGQ